MRSILIAILVASALTAGDAASLPMAVPARDPHLHFSGRWDTSRPDAPRCDWSACQVWVRFRGTALNVVLGGSTGAAFQAVIDGKPTAVLTVAPGQSVYAVAADLPAGEHTLELCKRTESGQLQLKGLQFATGSTLLDPPAFAHRIEFLGDSITAGYGNEASGPAEHFSLATENAWLAWAAIAARTLDAELMVEAVSGSFMMANDKKNRVVIPEVWDRMSPAPDSKKWDFSRWQADAVVIDLGNNDKGNKANPVDPQRWHDACRAFLASIRAAYPQAHIFLTIGPMGQAPIAAFNADIVAELRAAGEMKVHSLAFADQIKEDGYGADWHPSVRTHRKMADTIVAALRKELGW